MNRLAVYLRLMDALAACGGFGSRPYLWAVRRASDCVEWGGFAVSRLAWTGPNMVAALQESKPGCCPYCDRPLVRHSGGRPRTRTCGRELCLRQYRIDWKQDRYWADPEASREWWRHYHRRRARAKGSGAARKKTG